jgi:ribonuclease J
MKIKITALGGLNERGKNMYAVSVEDEIFILDAGLKYPDDKMLGIDYIIPNFDYLKENKDKIKGIFITHGHDEQMGALSDILSEMPDMPIYATEFTMALIENELNEDHVKASSLHIIEPYHAIEFKRASVFPVSLTHSIPGNVGFVINTKDGAIVYTGNFVFDQKMLGPYKTDIGKLAYVGKKGVLCLMSESLYADKQGYTSPHNRIYSIVRDVLIQNEGRILFNIFDSQFYRLQELLTEINKTDRNIVILGKRLENAINKAIKEKYLDFDSSKIKGLKNVNDEGIIVLISDEREKPFSNISRIIKGYDKFIRISDTDTVVFASPVYEGMEARATKIYDSVAKIGSNIIIVPTNKYLSNHASSEDLMMMINLMEPKYYFPVIGEYRHQVENKKAALKVGMKEENILLRLNGQVTFFKNGVLQETNEIVNTDEVLVDGKNSHDVSEIVIKDREMLSDNGIVIVSATVDRITKKTVAGPEIVTKGFIYMKDNIDILKEAEKISKEVILENTNKNFVDFNKIKMGIRDKLGRYFYKETECKPMILIVINEI